MNIFSGRLQTIKLYIETVSYISKYFDQFMWAGL